MFPPKYWLNKIQKNNPDQPIIKIQTKIDYDKNPSQCFNDIKDNSNYKIGLATVKKTSLKQSDGKFKLISGDIDLKQEFLEFRKNLINLIQTQYEKSEESIFTVALLNIIQNKRKEQNKKPTDQEKDQQKTKQNPLNIYLSSLYTDFF